MPATTTALTTPTTLEQAESRSKMARQAKQMLCAKQGHTLWPAEDDFPLPISSGTVFVHCTRCGVGAAIPLREGQLMTFEEIEGVCATSAAEVQRLCAEGGHTMADGRDAISTPHRFAFAAEADTQIVYRERCRRCYADLSEEYTRDSDGKIIPYVTP